MKVSYNWLNTYVSLDGITPEALADALTNAGLEVEGIEYQASGTNLTIGYVLEKKAHPDSDHLNVCQVDLGNNEVVQIVCGAPNVDAGQKVIVAKAGAVLPGGEIKAAKVRGQESNGMICALFELGVDKKMLREDQINGIEILPEDAPLGCDDPLGYLGLNDAVLDVKQTPNRADFMAMWSVAMETGAILNREVHLPNIEHAADEGKPTTLKIASKTDRCPVFLGKIINKVKVGPSPKWMSDHLHAAGIKSINNVVDISNYVMLETGQPLHFYDLAKMPHREITVVDDVDMTMTALDGVEYEIKKGDLLITTGGRPTGVAGIMGGDDSKIDEETSGIIIESALFNALSIRSTARRLGLNTEACSRYIKGLEPQSQIKAMARAVQLLKEYAAADDLEETVQVGEINTELTHVTETLEHINRHLGTDFELEEVVDVLKRLNLQPEVDGTSISMTIPSYRTDLLIPEDIDEEVIRLLGYDRLTDALPTMTATCGKLTSQQKMRRTVRTVLSGLGLNEVETYTLVSDRYLQDSILPLGEAVSLISPMSEERKNVRQSLFSTMLECLSYNQARKAEDVNIFEVSSVYAKDRETLKLGMVLSGNLQNSRLHHIQIPSDFYSAKGILLALMKKLGYEENRIYFKENNLDQKHFHPYRSAAVYLGKDLLGMMGQIHPLMQKQYACSDCIYAELNLDVLLSAKGSKVKFVPLDRYPSVKRDIALVADKQVSAEKLLDVIKKTNRQLIRNVEVFDVYEGEHIEQGKKSIAMSITYQSDHTLTDAEVNEVHEKILQRLKNECSAELRA